MKICLSFFAKTFTMKTNTGGNYSMNRTFIRLFASLCAAVSMLFTAVPTLASTNGGGPWGDIDGYYTWQINGKGWTVYSQNGYSWVYDDYGTRTYLDSYGNKLDGVTAAAAKTITQYSLTYNSTVNGVVVYSNPDGKLYTVSSNGALTYVGGGGSTPAPAPSPSPSVPNYTFYYQFTSPNGYHVYKDDYGNYWWYAQGGIPMKWTGGYPSGSYWRADIPNFSYYYSYKSSDGYYIYTDDYKNQWWFGSDGTPHLVRKGSGGGGVAPTPGGGQGGDSKPAGSNVDYSRSNKMEANGQQYVVYVGQYWQAPTTVSWAPAGTKLIGWDYAEGSNYVRWKPGAYIKNTGSDLFLYPVYGSSTGAGIGATR